jgi:hypothetical protein
MKKLAGAVLVVSMVAACSASNTPNGTGGQGGGGSGSGGSGGAATTSSTSSGSTACDAASCPSGCCAQGACVEGTANNQCGKGGQVCLDCGAVSLACTNQACAMVQPKCTAQTCPNGCCKDDMCEQGLSDQACGTGGEACKDCSAQSLACVNGLCMQ